MDQEQIKAGAQVATDHKNWNVLYCNEWTWSFEKEVNHICDTVEDIKAIHPQLKNLCVFRFSR